MRVISGGQTGADRAGLEAARELGLPTGGYAPSNFWTEKGPAPELASFGLVATGGSLSNRTRLNVEAADATIVFSCRPSPGSALTVDLAKRASKALLVVNPFAVDVTQTILDFLRAHRPGALNIAGHRESRAPGIQERVFSVLLFVFGAYLQDAENS